MIPLLLAAWQAHHARSRRAAALLDQYVRAHGWTHQEAAFRMGISEQSFSKQISGAEGMNFWRVLLLPDDIVIPWLSGLLRELSGDLVRDPEFERIVLLVSAFVSRKRGTVKIERLDQQERSA